LTKRKKKGYDNCLSVYQLRPVIRVGSEACPSLRQQPDNEKPVQEKTEAELSEHFNIDWRKNQQKKKKSADR
jgi:hypothetical protein